MRYILISFTILVTLAVVTTVFMRLAPMPPEIWHLDPAEVTSPETPNFVLMRGDEAPIFDGTVDGLAAMLDVIARGDGARLIAGSVAEGHMTYVQRTRLMGYPDAISIRVRDMGGGRVAVDIFCRSRFGYSDMGVNERRVNRWLAALTP
ncbi:DUF1499 domain-containing protein [Rhodophyticola sp. CCM32]|uniref:DUF1499 domain-containing protein n=1 Tax=Rhodophyticola sp. CCM32 TaxID=2916397 RepID=UPI00107F716A|nr:DUF1499 domain-containing protein [Rhodophyticola sp. CCM32]QBX99971.1 DUF1499 domain-containing protein [Rhodophyticola sp. CCM32]